MVYLNMRERMWQISIAFVIFQQKVASVEIFCGPGQKLVPAHNGTPDSCEICSPNHYQDKIKHRDQECKHCSPFDHSDFQHIERLNCTKTQYRIATCVHGYFLNQDECHKCTNCSSLGKHQAHVCQKDQDAVCCDVDEGVPEHDSCRYDPVYCGRGQYLVVGVSCGGEACQPCPSGSNNTERCHRKRECAELSRIGNSSAIVISVIVIIAVAVSLFVLLFCFTRAKNIQFSYLPKYVCNLCSQKAVKAEGYHTMDDFQ